MTFDRNLLPDPVSYYESQGLILKGPSSSLWKTTSCSFHVGSDSMRINTGNGAWRCMNCGESGGDVLAYEIKAYCKEFVQAAKDLGCWVDDGRPKPNYKPKTLNPIMALSVMKFEVTLVIVVACSISYDLNLPEEDRARLIVAANRIIVLAEEYV